MPINTGFRINNTATGFAANTDLADIFVKRDVMATGSLFGGGNTTIINQSSGSNISPSYIPGFTSWRTVDGSRGINSGNIFAIDRNGYLYGIGLNAYGQLGDGTTVSKTSYTLVLGSMYWVDVATSDHTTAGITNDGKLWTWGYNVYGQLGDNSTTNKSSPVSFITTGNSPWVSVAVGNYCTFGVKADGTLWSCGYNANGRLGDGTTTSRTSPVSVTGGITTWKKVSAAGAYALGLTSAGVLYGWGQNTSGYLGDNTTVAKSSPVTVVGGLTWKTMSAGYITSAAITTSGVLYAWGYNGYGAVGDGTTTNRSSPVTVAGGGTDWKSVSISEHAVALKANGSVWTWGRDAVGELITGTIANRSSPGTTVYGSSNTIWRQVTAVGDKGTVLLT